MRPGRVNTYHNDPFVAAPANNAFVIALSRFLPVVCTTVVAGVVLTASLASHCFIPVFICPALLHRAVSISDPIYGDSRANDRFSLVNEYPFLVWEIVIFPFDGRSKITEWRASIPNFFILAKNFYYTTRYDPAFSRQEISKFGVFRDEMWYIKYDIKKIMEREGLRVTLLCVSSRWIANETGGSSKVVEQWDLEIYALILLWRYVRTGGKKKQNRNRETFVSEAADISKNLTYNGGPPSKTFTYDDGFGGPFLDHPLAQTRRFLRFKRIL